jgi:hypothetical protein
MEEIAVLTAIAGVGFLIGLAVRRWWVALFPLVLAGALVLIVALSDSDGGDLPHEGAVTLAVAIFGTIGVTAAVGLLGGVLVGRWWRVWRARSS